MVVVLGESTDLGMGILVLQVHLVELLPVGLKDVQSGSVGNPQSDIGVVKYLVDRQTCEFVASRVS